VACPDYQQHIHSREALQIFQSAVLVAQKDIHNDYYKKHSGNPHHIPLPVPTSSPCSRVEKETKAPDPVTTVKPVLRFANIPSSLSAVKSGSRGSDESPCLGICPDPGSPVILNQWKAWSVYQAQLHTSKCSLYNQTTKQKKKKSVKSQDVFE
jgi:hypothetical protein